jgi:hypothetical protein
LRTAAAGRSRWNRRTGPRELGDVVRDFKAKSAPGGHPDFQSYVGGVPYHGLVGIELGSDRKPVYASQCEATLVGGAAGCPEGQVTTSKTSFDQWYRFTADVNKPYLVYLQFAPNGKVSTFQRRRHHRLGPVGDGARPRERP